MKRMLFIAPVTTKHGQGRISVEALNIFRALGLEMTVLDIHKSRDGLRHKLFSEIFIISKLIWALLKSRYEFVYFTPSRRKASSLKDSLILLLSKVFNRRCRTVAHLHGSDLFQLLELSGLYGKVLNHLYFQNLDVMVILSPSHKKFALGDDYKRYKVIPNFADRGFLELAKLAQRIRAEAAEENALADIAHSSPGSPIRFFHLSNPDINKGLRGAFQFCENLSRREGIRVELGIIGWTIEDFFNIFSESPLSQGTGFSFNFLGRLDGQDKIDAMLYYQNCLFFSEYPSEAQPLAIIESLALGIPVVTTGFKMLGDFRKAGAIILENSFAYLDTKALESSRSLIQSELGNSFTFENFEESLRELIQADNNMAGHFYD